MTRRRILIAVAVIVVVLVAIGGYWLWQFEQWQATFLGQANDTLNQTSEMLANLKIVAPNLDGVARLDGEVTAVTFTVSNPSDQLMKDIAFSGLTVGNAEPREKAELPIKIAELGPGKSQQFVLHYDGLTWLGGDVRPTRTDLDWAMKNLSYNYSWIAVIVPKPTAKTPNVVASPSEIRCNGGSMGSVPLDAKQARELKSRRDANVKQ